jgi:hypothetical protein
MLVKINQFVKLFPLFGDNGVTALGVAGQCFVIVIPLKSQDTVPLTTCPSNVATVGGSTSKAVMKIHLP